MLAMAAREADAIWTGADSVESLRAAAQGRRLKLLVGETPPLRSEMAGALKAAVTQDSDTPAADAAPPQTMAEWGASVRARDHLIDQLLITTWERTPQAMLEILRAVKETLS
jgi:hypothetical protein